MARVNSHFFGTGLAICCLALGAITLASNGDAAGTRSPASPNVAECLTAVDWGDNMVGPLCGVFAACTAVEMVGLRADPREFIAKRYVGQCGGSSPLELARVVEESGASACILSRLSSLDLRLIDCPVIANVRVNPASNRFNHWVVVVPTDLGVTVFDGLQPASEISMAKFLGIWSGVGICVSRDQNSPLVSIWLGRSTVCLTLLVAGILMLRNGGPLSRARHAGVFKQCCGVCAASLILCVAGNLAFGDLIHHREGVVVATAVSRSGNFRVGTLADAAQAAARGDMLLVDARRVEDYQLGTIDGAVNIPVTASPWAMSKYLQHLDRDTPVVVFCQSAACGYDETVGTQLVSLGFTNVTVCDEGWREYRESARGNNSR